MFVLQFVFGIIHGSGRVVENREGLETHHVTWTQGGDFCPTICKYVRNKPESEFLTGQAEYWSSCEHLGSCLAMEEAWQRG